MMGTAYEPEELARLEATHQRHTLFFAMLPDAAAREQIARLARVLKQVHQTYAPLTKPENLHVSLFMVERYRGAPPAHVLPGALAAGAAVQAAPFEIRFNQTASFVGHDKSNAKQRQAPFVLFGDDGGAVQTLRKTIALAMRRHGLGYAVKDVKAFTPHVTLWWDEETIEPHPIAPIAWTVRELVLIDSWQGLRRHDHAGRWTLGA